jgi:hypothetical protein
MSSRIAATVDFEVNEGGQLRARVGGFFRALRDSRNVAIGAAPDAKHRMHDRMQRESLPIDRHRNRVDQKRHVVVDDLDDRVIRVPAMLFENRVVDAQPFLARHEALRSLPVRERGAI